MTQNGKKFLEAISQKEELKEKFSKITNLKEAIAFAKENGFDLREEDLKTAEEGLMDDDDLDSVAGGFQSIREFCASQMSGPVYDMPEDDPVYDMPDHCELGISDPSAIKPDVETW